MKKAKLRLNKTILRRLSKREAEGVQAGMDGNPPPMVQPATIGWECQESLRLSCWNCPRPPEKSAFCY
jgi:hypothetical protein